MVDKPNKVENIVVVLDRIKNQVTSEPRNADTWAGVIDDLLDDLQDMELFGHNAEGDPRGDFRKGNWELSGNIIQK